MPEISSRIAIEEKKGIMQNPCMDDREIKSLIGANLRRLRESRRLKSSEAADMAGIPPGQYSRYENGRGISPKTLAHLCNVFQVDPIEFFRPVRGLGRVAENSDDYVSLTDPRLTEKIQVPDDSMSPKYEPGETIYVTRRSEPPRDGEYVLARLENGDSLIRQVHILKNGVLILRPLNPQKMPLLVNEPEVHLHPILATRPQESSKK